MQIFKKINKLSKLCIKINMNSNYIKIKIDKVFFFYILIIIIIFLKFIIINLIYFEMKIKNKLLKKRHKVLLRVDLMLQNNNN